MKTIRNIKELSKLVKTSKKYIIMYMLLSILISIVGVIGPLISAKQLVGITEGAWNQVILIAVLIFFLSILDTLILSISLAISICNLLIIILENFSEQKLIAKLIRLLNIDKKNIKTAIKIT